MIIGENKKALKQPKKNILPPFDDEEGWKPTNPNLIYDIQRNEYSVSFRAKGLYHALYYELDSSIVSLIAGKKVTASVVNRTKDPTNIQFNINDNGVWKYIGNITTDKHTVEIPKGALSVQLRIQSNTAEDSLHYVENIQLEVGEGVTDFEEKVEVNKIAKKGLFFDGAGHVSTGITDFLNTHRSFSMEATFNPTYPKLPRGEGIVFGWAGYNEGILYDAINNYVRVQIHWRKKSDGAILRDSIVVPMNEGERATITMTYDSVNRKISVYKNKVLIHSGVTTCSDPAIYDFLPYTGTTLAFGATIVNGWAFGGIIEGGKLWSTALSSEEVVSGSDLNNLVLDYDFRNQDVSSSTIIDTARGNHGTNSGARYLQRCSKKRPKKNLLPLFNQWTHNSSDYFKRIEDNYIEVKDTTPASYGSFYYVVKVKPNTIYTVSGEGTLYLGVFANDAGVSGISGYKLNLNTFNSGNRTEIRIYVKNYNLSGAGLYMKNVQLEEGSSATPYSEYKLVGGGKIKSTIAKKSYKKYPFKFTRESVSEFGGKSIGYNQPRITNDGGVIVEEKTANILKGKSGVGIASATVAKVSDYAYNVTTANTAISGINISNVITNDGKTKTFSGFIKGQAGVIVNLQIHGSVQPITLTGERDFFSITGSSSTNLSLAVFTGYQTSPNQVTSFILEDLQVESKPYNTSFTKDSREAETLFIENGTNLLDSERGSIEVEVTPMNKAGDSSSMDFGFHDLVTYIPGSGGFIARRNGGYYYLYVYNSSGLYSTFAPIIYSLGDTIKYRLSWDKKRDVSELYVDGILVATTKAFDINLNQRIYIGCGDTSRGRGNAVYKNFTIRNRHGETVFKL